MPHYAHQALQQVIDFCLEKWAEADTSAELNGDQKTGRKVAYNAVVQYARNLLNNP